MPRQMIKPIVYYTRNHQYQIKRKYSIRVVTRETTRTVSNPRVSSQMVKFSPASYIRNNSNWL